MASPSPSHRGMIYVVVGLAVSSRIPGDLSGTIYGIPFSVARTYPFLVIDTIHQDLGDQIMQQLQIRVGLLAHYFQVTHIDHDHLRRSLLLFGGTNSLIRLIDPFGQLVRTGHLHPSPERSCEAFLSNSLDGVTALDIIRAIGLMTDVFGRDLAMELLERFFKIGQEPTRHLLEDPDLQQSFRLAFSPSVMNEHSATAPSDTTLSSTSSRSTMYSDTVPRQINHSSNTRLDRSRRGRPRNYRRVGHRHHDSASSTQSTSTSSVPERKAVKCEWTGCERHVPFLTPRGLREHYMLKHEIPAMQAHNEAKAAFETAAEFTPRARFLEAPRTPYDNRHNRNSRPAHTDLEGIGHQFSAGPAADPVSPSMPLTPREGNTTFQSFPPYGSKSGLIFSPHDQGGASYSDADTFSFGLAGQSELPWNHNQMSVLPEGDYSILFGEINNGHAVNLPEFHADFDRQDPLNRYASQTYDYSS